MKALAYPFNASAGISHRRVGKASTFPQKIGKVNNDEISLKPHNDKNLVPYRPIVLTTNSTPSPNPSPWERGKIAFTLAEVLITLGIIGVVAALTLPVITEKVNEIIMVNKLKKVYSVLSQAMLYTAAADGDYSSLSLQDGSIQSIEQWYRKALKPQLHITKECINTAGCWAKGVKTLNGAEPYASRGDKGIGDDIIIFRTNDGYNVNIDAYTYSAEGRFGVKLKNTGNDYLGVFVDVNGDKKPNLIGKDIFMFIFSPDIGFVPAGRNATDEVVNANCSSADTSNMSGYYCFEKIVRNNWHIDKNFYN